MARMTKAQTRKRLEEAGNKLDKAMRYSDTPMSPALRMELFKMMNRIIILLLHQLVRTPSLVPLLTGVV